MSTGTGRAFVLLAAFAFTPTVSLGQAQPAPAFGPHLGENPLRTPEPDPVSQGVSSPPALAQPVTPPATLHPSENGSSALVPPSSPAPDGQGSASHVTPTLEQTAPPNSTVPASAEGGQQEKPGPTKLSIDEQINSVQNASQLDEATKAELLKRYKAALDWINAAEEAAKKTAQYQAEIAGVSELVAQVKSQLAAPLPEPSTAFAADATLQQMEQSLTLAESQFREADSQLAKCEDELKRRGERKAELAKLTDDTRKRFDEAKKLVAVAGNGELTELAAARRVEVEARIKALTNQLERYRVEGQRHDALVELLPLQRDLARRIRNYCEKAVVTLQQAVSAKRKAESERQAREARREVANAHPALRQLAERNAELAEQHKRLASSLTETADAVAATDRQISQLATDYENIQEQVRYAGNSSSIGLVLRKKRGELPDVRECEETIRFVTREMPDANLVRMGLEEERAALGDLDAAVAEAIEKLDDPVASSQGPLLEPTVRELLEKKRDLLDTLTSDYDDYLTELSELEVSNRRLAAEIREVAGYVDERVLWVRSADMLRPRDVTDTIDGFVQLARPGPWIDLSKSCGLDAFRRAGTVALVVLLTGLLIAFQARLRNRFRAICVVSSGSTTLQLWPTVQGLLLAAAIAGPWSLLLLFAGWRIASVGGAAGLASAVGWGLSHVAILFWFSEFTRQICQRERLAETHFGWSSYSLGIVRRHLRWLTFLGLPLIFLVVFAYHYQEGAWNDSLGRLAFIGTLLLLTVFMHAVLFAKDNVLREIVLHNPKGWLARLRGLLYVAAIGLPLSLAVLAVVGYYYSAQQLALRMEVTLAMVLGLVLLHAVASRWFLVKRRNLAIAQSQQRQGQETSPAPADSPVSLPNDGERDLSAIHQQLHYLLANAVAVCLFAGSWMIWVDVLPALNVLDKQELWQTTVEVVEIHEDPDGNEVRQRIPKEVPTTARHALLAGLILLAAFVIGRHLPALLEITVLDRLPFDKGGRHAISVILRYLVALTGLIMACRTMNITWSSVQWLAAGMTVGLGFGLQEIFANFVSGLILLFERPIRVGDVITLGDITGTVTNIRIRATTVTNWDRKELIVPNKELITGRLLNWTLTDSTNRIVITVGVAYKSDTRKARELILAIAHDHPNVLEDPGPRVTFEAFGDSTLNFVLRCYIASMDIRLDTIHELHEAIHDRFNEEGVEIAFPQRDLHVRSVEQAVSLAAPTVQAQDKAA